MTPDRSAAWRWGALVVGLLGFQVALGVYAIVLATGDPSVAVVPDYYEKALRWDEKVHAEKTSKALAWNVAVEEVSASNPRSGLTVCVTGPGGDPVKLAEGAVKLYHHARAAEVIESKLSADREANLLSLENCIDQPGWWQLEMQLTDLHGNQYVESRQVYFTCPRAIDNAS